MEIIIGILLASLVLYLSAKLLWRESGVSRVWRMYKRALKLYTNGKIADTLDPLSECIALTATSVFPKIAINALILRSNALFDLGRYDDAFKDLDLCESLFGKKCAGLVQYERSCFYERLGDISQAYFHMNAACEIDSNLRFLQIHPLAWLIFRKPSKND